MGVERDGGGFALGGAVFLEKVSQGMSARPLEPEAHMRLHLSMGWLCPGESIAYPSPRLTRDCSELVPGLSH